MEVNPKAAALICEDHLTKPADRRDGSLGYAKRLSERPIGHLDSKKQSAPQA
jgi:hypothetical protein